MKWSSTQSQVVQSQDIQSNSDCVGATVAYLALMVTLWGGVGLIAILTSWFLQ